MTSSEARFETRDRLSTPRNARWLTEQTPLLRPFVAYDALHQQVIVGLDDNGERSAYSCHDIRTVPAILGALAECMAEHQRARAADVLRTEALIEDDDEFKDALYALADRIRGGSHAR